MHYLYAFLAFILGFSQAPTSLASSAPACQFDDVLTAYPELEQWQYSLLDTYFRLPADYVPHDLAGIPRTLSADKPRRLRSFVLPALQDMADAASAAGFPIAVQSAYRSYDYQSFTFNYWVETIGMEKALTSSARAGHSEHQLGTVIDVRAAGGGAAWDFEDWGETPTGAWMLANSWRYGFVLSYPKGKEALTCYSYEPWHYRYVGKDIARHLYDTGLSLREWLWLQQP